jgi:hypothetical protein
VIRVDEPTTRGEPLTQKGRKLLASNLFPFWVQGSPRVVGSSTQKGRKLLASNLFPFWVRQSVTL